MIPTIHKTENNLESQKNRDDNSIKFSRKCKTVYNWLIKGDELTALWAANNWVSSLPRRILDLKESGIEISDRWDRGVKIWFMTPEQINNNKLKYNG